MALSKVRLGDLIELVEEPNKDLLFGEKDVRGMTITKQIIPTKADVAGADLSKYWIVRPNYFVYNPRTHGKKIGLGYNDSGKSFIISWNNVSFRIKEAMKNKILPQYLFLHFNRVEWDRNACFCSWGSSTEVFSWDALGDMVLELPPIDIQQKYVDIYQGMVNNQKAYERGLEDLKLVCDGYFDVAKKQYTVSLGELIEKVDVRNSSNLYSAKDVRGITNKKEFSETKADISTVDLSKFKVVKPRQFAYNSRTDGREMLVLALNREDYPIIVTFNYNVFSIRQEKIDMIDLDYLYAFFKRSEFDRRVRFNSWGSSQELLSWDNLCNIQVPVPTIKKQEAVAEIINLYFKRKAINERLKAQIKDICPILIKGSIDEARR